MDSVCETNGGEITTSASPRWASRNSCLRSVAAWLLLAAATWAAHGWTLHDGLTLDDHWHQKCLRELGWSPADLIRTTTIDPQNFIHQWWQERPIRFQYARPLSVLLMKVVFVLSGGSVVAQHAVSLAMHVVVAGLVYHLGLRMTGRWLWSALGGLLLVLYPPSVYAVGWLAAQNAVLQTALSVAAVLVYLRASGPETAGRPYAAGCAVPPIHRGAMIATMCLWALALLSRENAIVLPAFMLASDWAFGGRERVRARRGVYALMAVIGALYLVWRFAVVYAPMPDVYVRRPEDWGYLPWIVAKLMHYLVGAVWPSAMVIGPTGRFNPFQEVPGDCLLMAAILLVVGVGYWRYGRPARGWWLWPLWILLAVLPLLPVMATPHAGYMCGVGFAVGVVVGPALAGKRRTVSTDRRPVRGGRWRHVVVTVVLLVSAALTLFYRGFWKGMILAERMTTMPLIAQGRPEGATDLFLINLPFVSLYTRLCLEEAWGPEAEKLRCHALVYSPLLERAEQRCVVEQIDDHSLSVRIEGRPYFAGLLGRFLVEAQRRSGRFQAEQLISGEFFDVLVDQAGPEGVSGLTFTFPRPLTDPSYCFYLTSYECGAARIRFQPPGTPPADCPTKPSPADLAAVRAAGDRLRSGQAAAGLLLVDGLGASDPAVRAASAGAILPRARIVAEALGATEQSDLDLLAAAFGVSETDANLDEGPPERPSHRRPPVVREMGSAKNDPDALAAAARRVRQWWCASVTDQTLADLWRDRPEMRAMRQGRHEIQRGPYWAGKACHTDLYLTGPPFPGPR